MKPEPVRSQGDLFKIFGIDDKKLLDLISLRSQYKKHHIPKKSGGLRTIANPPRDLKLFHKKLVGYFSQIKKTDFAFGGVKGKCRRDVALIHIKNHHILKCDIKNCFPSISERIVVKELLDLSFSYKYARIFAKILTLEGTLPQGAPSSPVIANLILDNVDIQVTKKLPSGAKYSRWIDDIIVSFPKRFEHNAIEEVSKNIENTIIRNGFILKDEIKVVPKEHCSNLLGLSVSKKINVPKKWYKILRSQVNRLSKGYYRDEEKEKIESTVKGKMTLLKEVTKQHRKRTRYEKLAHRFKNLY